MNITSSKKHVSPLLFVDHRDSFSANLAAALRISGVDLVEVQSQHLPQDSRSIKELSRTYSGLVLSPGPGNPADWARSLHVLTTGFVDKPVLGVCLGLQMLLLASGLEVDKLSVLPEHGRLHDLDCLIPSGKLTNEFDAYLSYSGKWVFYNSLGCSATDNECVSKGWRVHGRECEVVAVAEHVSRPHVGIQFHPESFVDYGTNKFFTDTKRGTVMRLNDSNGLERARRVESSPPGSPDAEPRYG